MMHMDLQQIGQKLREARKSQGRTQSQVAAPLGMSRATVSAIENGTVSEIGVRKLMGLCASLGLALSVAPRDQRPTYLELREEQRAALRSRA
jgi:transcriptional regulator with XRE-family HTH domain